MGQLLSSRKLETDELEDYIERFITALFEEHKLLESSALNFIKLEILMQRSIFKTLYPVLLVPNPTSEVYCKNVLYLRSRIIDHAEKPFSCQVTEHPDWAVFPLQDVTRVVEQIAYEYVSTNTVLAFFFPIPLFT